MELRCIDFNTDLLDLSAVSPLKESRRGYSYSNSWHNPMIGSSAKDAIMSVEEMKIRGELEGEMERDLEEEIKDGIYRLALRLHRLYERRKERKGKMELSEVNIIIRMDGGTKIEIKETKKEAPVRRRNRATAARVAEGMQAPDTKRYDWSKSLRQKGANPGIDMNKKMISEGSTYQARKSYDHNLKIDNARIKKENAGGDHNIVQLGWRF